MQCLIIIQNNWWQRFIFSLSTVCIISMAALESRSGALCVFWLIRSSSITQRASDDQRLGWSVLLTIVVKFKQHILTSDEVLNTVFVIHFSRISFFFPVMLYYSYTLMFSLFYSIVAMVCVSFCSLLDDDCLSGNKRITYLLTYILRNRFSVSLI